MNTAVIRSQITYINGTAGQLRYRFVISSQSESFDILSSSYGVWSLEVTLSSNLLNIARISKSPTSYYTENFQQ